MEFKIYHWISDQTMVYLDGSESEGYSFQTAIEFAKDNASSWSEHYFYVLNGLTMKTAYSVINRNGMLVQQDRR